MHTDSPSPVDPQQDSQIDPRVRELFRRFKLEPGPTVPDESAQDVGTRALAAWETFAPRLTGVAMAESSHRPKHIRTRTTAHRSWIMAVVACLLVAVGTGLWMARSGPSFTAAPRAFATKPGQQMTVRLADGSTILLAPATTISVTATTVEMQGAAYFTVASQASRPLTVRTRNAVVHVLGTRFEVRQFAGESVSRIVVEEGRVAVQSLSGGERPRPINAEPRAVASAGMLAEVSDSGVTLTSDIDARTLTGWVRGTLVFKRVPLREVVAEVGRVYGASVRVADSALAERPVLAEVYVSDLSLRQVLNLLSEAMTAHYVEDRGTFVLKPGNSAKGESFERKAPYQLPLQENQYGR